MSDTLAIAAVTETLTDLLNAIAVEETTLAPLTVSAMPPDLARTGQSKPRQLNMFLYGVSPNAGWANADLPFHDGGGARVAQPVLALDLHYLMTAYGLDDDHTEAQRLMAHAMSIIHDHGLLRPADVRAALDRAGSPLQASDLDKQIDRVKVSPERLSDEDMFRMWTVFGVQYRLSVGYHASVVLIERRRAARSALPVREAHLTAVPLRDPVIEDVLPKPATSGTTMTVTGTNLAADVVRARIADTEKLLMSSEVSARRLTFALPTGLRAGPNTIQVIQEVALPGTGQSRRFFTSNVVAFVLAPKIASALPASIARGAVLNVGIDPSVGRDQRVALLLGSRAVPRVLTSTAPAMAMSADFLLPADLTPGDHLVRIVVDGAETGLIVGGPGPQAGLYIGPTITVT